MNLLHYHYKTAVPPYYRHMHIWSIFEGYNIMLSCRSLCKPQKCSFEFNHHMFVILQLDVNFHVNIRLHCLVFSKSWLILQANCIWLKIKTTHVNLEKNSFYHKKLCSFLWICINIISLYPLTISIFTRTNQKKFEVYISNSS